VEVHRHHRRCPAAFHQVSPSLQARSHQQHSSSPGRYPRAGFLLQPKSSWLQAADTLQAPLPLRACCRLGPKASAPPLLRLRFLLCQHLQRGARLGRAGAILPRLMRLPPLPGPPLRRPFLPVPTTTTTAAPRHCRCRWPPTCLEGRRRRSPPPPPPRTHCSSCSSSSSSNKFRTTPQNRLVDLRLRLGRVGCLPCRRAFVNESLMGSMTNDGLLSLTASWLRGGAQRTSTQWRVAALLLSLSWAADLMRQRTR